MTDLRNDRPAGEVDDTIVEPVSGEPIETGGELERVVITDSAPPPPAAIPEAVVEPTGPRVTTERERITVEDDGSVSRRVDRVEQEPMRRERRPSLWLALLVILAFALGAIAIAWYVSQEDSTAVPAVEGLALDDAVSRLQDDGFKADIVSQPNEAPQGTVFRQSPAAGTELDEGSMVQLLSSQGPNDVAVPNAIGVPESEARDRLAAAGLRASVFQVFSDEPEGVVVAQAPDAGVKAAEGSAVRLNVSKGSGLVAVPSVVGASQADAEAQLDAAGLEANVVQVPSKEPAGTVVAQNPTSGQVREGSAVRLNVSTGT